MGVDTGACEYTVGSEASPNAARCGNTEVHHRDETPHNGSRPGVTPGDGLVKDGRFGPMIGQSPAMRQVYHMISRVAPTSATVMICGETGTGKELVARTIHEMSLRVDAPFVAINCGAVAPSLIESELFGHEKGAFTSAGQTHHGVFERAAGGTLFLDEITEMAPELQVRLLRVLETGRIVRIGGEHEIAVNVRTIAATNRDPAAAVARNEFRHDLMHRLAVFPIHLPPLRDRGDDIVILAQSFLEALNQSAGTRKTFAPQVMDYLRKYAWPGNVRELRNAVNCAFILSDGLIDAPLLSHMLPEHKPAPDTLISALVGMTIAEIEERIICATLNRYQGDKRLAAEKLGICLKTLYNRLNSYERR